MAFLNEGHRRVQKRSKMKELLIKVQAAFEANADVDLYYVTSDGQCFEAKSYAVLHSKSLADQKVHLWSRKAVENLLAKDAESGGSKAVKEPTVDELKARLAQEFKVSEDELKGKKKAELVEMLAKCIEAASTAGEGDSGDQ